MPLKEVEEFENIDHSKRKFLKYAYLTAISTGIKALIPKKLLADDNDTKRFPKDEVNRVEEIWENKENDNKKILYINPEQCHYTRKFHHKNIGSSLIVIMPIPLETETQRKIDLKVFTNRPSEIVLDQHGNKFFQLKGDNKIEITEDFTP